MKPARAIASCFLVLCAIAVVSGAAADPALSGQADGEVWHIDDEPLRYGDCSAGFAGQASKPYRLVLKVSGAAEGPWSVRFNTGRKTGEPLVLNQSNAKVGEEFLSPLLNENKDHYCAEKTGEPPSIVAVRRIVPDPRATRVLSVRGTTENAEPNWIDFKDAINKLDGVFSAKDPPGGVLTLWPESHALTRAERESRLAAVSNAIIYLNLEKSIENAQSNKIAVLETCTGFYVAPNVILTNRHCAAPKARIDDPVRYRTWGWVRRNLKGDTLATTAPDLQRLKVTLIGDIMSVGPIDDWARAPETLSENPPPVGAAADFGVGRHLYADFALLWTNDPMPSPSPLRFAAAPTERIAIPQYPFGNKLQLAFDADCRSMRFESAEMRRSKQPTATALYIVRRHGCDTERGSSGSPVMDRALGAVYALHFRGCLAGTSRLQCENSAVPAAVLAVAIEAAARRIAGSPEIALTPEARCALLTYRTVAASQDSLGLGAVRPDVPDFQLEGACSA
jgi:hypothetical protein